MNRITLIAIISGIVLLVALTWGYLFIFGTPDSAKAVFARFGIVDTTVVVDENDTRIDTSPVGADGEVRALRQLTLRPVAGMQFSGENDIRYVERGTGYVYEIDLVSGEETQITDTTFERIIDAEVSVSGNRILLTHEEEEGEEVRVSIGTIQKNDGGVSELSTLLLPRGAHNATFSDSGTEIYYLLPTGDTSEAHEYSLAEGEDRILFTIPFTAARVSWGSPHYVYTTPTAELLGYVYEVGSDGSLTHVREGGFGLTALGYPNGVITSTQRGGRVAGFAYEGADVYELPIEVYPEKCAVIHTRVSALLCGAPFVASTGDYPDAWYKGAISFEDQLWLVLVQEEEAALLADPQNDTGRSIDVQKIGVNEDGTQFLLINKNDNALWLFEPIF